MRPRPALWRLPARRRRQSSLLSPIVLGLSIWIAFPTVSARQDVSSLLSGLAGGSAGWDAYVEKSGAGSVQQAELHFSAGDVVSASLSGAGVEAPGIGRVALMATNAVASARPDEERINRRDKKGRIVKMAPVAPPRLFNAGSIFQRQSSLFAPPADGALRMAFAETKIAGKEIEIAEAFHPKKTSRPNADMPAMLAALVNNDRADILATAYAPVEPDYEKKSPFESLFKDKSDPDAGRFIPPMEAGDHAWVGSALPASVFSKREQQCLTAGVYFEARGEAVKGQAAVAQVILNRVRNPAYPDTVCGVVYQNDKWRNGCQFSFACDGIRDRVADKQSWTIAEDVAMAVTAGKIWLPEVGSSTHYHATYVHPRWARTMERMKRIGRHIFYRTYGGGWS